MFIALARDERALGVWVPIMAHRVRRHLAEVPCQFGSLAVGHHRRRDRERRQHYRTGSVARRIVPECNKRGVCKVVVQVEQVLLEILLQRPSWTAWNTSAGRRITAPGTVNGSSLGARWLRLRWPSALARRRQISAWTAPAGYAGSCTASHVPRHSIAFRPERAPRVRGFPRGHRRVRCDRGTRRLGAAGTPLRGAAANGLALSPAARPLPAKTMSQTPR
jgi:hypothetical protein